MVGVIEETVCPICSQFKSKSLVKLNEHVVIEHDTNLQKLWDQLNGGPKLCKCGCGQVTKWWNWKRGYSDLLKGHNGNIYALHDEVKAQEISQKRRKKLLGKKSWAKGLTKETDERIRQKGTNTSIGLKRAFKDGTIKSWAKGLTKNNDQRIAKASKNLKTSYEDGRLIPWAKGLTKETDERILDMSLKVSLAHRKRNLRERLDNIKRLSIDEIKSRIESNGNLTITDVSNYVNDNTPSILIKCSKCGLETRDSLRRLQYGRCYNCDPGGSISQCEIYDYVKSLGVDVIANDRSVIDGNIRKNELDIYIPKQQFAIEYNGLYWHSSLHKSDVYHDNKTQQAISMGVKLFHIFEDEWRDKQDIVKSMINCNLKFITNKVHARKCSVVVLTPKEKRAFFDENHIDGDVASTITFGLTYESIVVAAMSLRKPFHKKYNRSLEVARMCSLKDTVVIGGLSKLTSSVKLWARNNGYQRLITYVDTRLGTGESWTKSGWSLVDETTPRFWWTDFQQRFNRFKYRADKSRNMSEYDVASEANVVKIWGCRNLIFEIVLMP